MKYLDQARTAALTFAAALLVATRFPGDPIVAWTAIGLALIALTLGAYSTHTDAPAWASTLSVVVTLALLAVPPSPDAWLAALPTWAIALVVLLALHLYTRQGDNQAPQLGHDADDAALGIEWGWIPLLALVGLVLALPWLLVPVLPDRWGALFLFNAAPAPLIFGGLIAGIVALLAWARHRDASTNPSVASEASQEGAP